MSAEEGGRVTQRQLYELILQQDRDAVVREARIDAKIDLLAGEIRRQSTDQIATLTRLCSITEAHEKHLDKVDARDKWGNIISGIGIAIGTALGIIVSPKQ